jgi:type II secretory ATPase GspE/PulE/Tfp pilus assembly ATPase PilB-like protein
MMATEEDIIALGLSDQQLATAHLRHGRGCLQCQQTGYRGRFAVYESLRINSAIRQLIRRHARAEEILPLARQMGWRPLLEAGIARALAGDTTLAEVRRVLYQVD